MPATVVAQRLRLQGFGGSLTILKDHLRRVRLLFADAQANQRTSYQPGELAQTDWWEPGIRVPVGRGQTRDVFGLVTGLPFSAAFRVVFAFNQTVAAFCPALVGGLARLGGLPKAMVSDNDSAIVACRRGGAVRLVDEVAGLYGQLGLKSVPLRPYVPQGKVLVSYCTSGCWLGENSFLDRASLPCNQAWVGGVGWVEESLVLVVGFVRAEQPGAVPGLDGGEMHADPLGNLADAEQPFGAEPVGVAGQLVGAA